LTCSEPQRVFWPLPLFGLLWCWG